MVGRDFWDPSVAVMSFASLVFAVLGLMWAIFYWLVKVFGLDEVEA